MPLDSNHDGREKVGAKTNGQFFYTFEKCASRTWNVKTMRSMYSIVPVKERDASKDLHVRALLAVSIKNTRISDA